MFLTVKVAQIIMLFSVGISYFPIQELKSFYDIKYLPLIARN